MYKVIDGSGNVYMQYTYTAEDEFERMIVENVEQIFGAEGIYFDIKRRIGTPHRGATVPDGFYLDLTFHNAPKLYLVEVELECHDVYDHIGSQILKFGRSSETDKYRLKSILLQAVNSDPAKQAKLQRFFSLSRYESISELLDRVIFENKPATIIVIDKVTEDLYGMMAQLTMPTEAIEAQTYVCGGRKLHRFSPFKADVIADMPAGQDADGLDTIVVPAREDGFNDEFLRNERWYSVRISAAMVDKIKYIAAYQVQPVSAITYIAQVARIERFMESNKYMLLFERGTVKKINRIPLGTNRALAPQGPRYTSYSKLSTAHTLDDLWN